MADPKDTGVNQAQDPPRKLLNGGVDPSVGRDTQFKPGESGNPAGKPKGSKHINTWIQELVEDEEFEAKLFDAKSMSVVDFKGAPIKAIVGAAVNEALLSNDPNVRKAAREWLAKYGWPAKNEISGPDGGPVVALVEFVDADDKGPSS